jgi:hypothetical protein
MEEYKKAKQYVVRRIKQDPEELKLEMNKLLPNIIKAVQENPQLTNEIILYTNSQLEKVNGGNEFFGDNEDIVMTLSVVTVIGLVALAIRYLLMSGQKNEGNEGEREGSKRIGFVENLLSETQNKVLFISHLSIFNEMQKYKNYFEHEKGKKYEKLRLHPFVERKPLQEDEKYTFTNGTEDFNIENATIPLIENVVSASFNQKIPDICFFINPDYFSYVPDLVDELIVNIQKYPDTKFNFTFILMVNDKTFNDMPNIIYAKIHTPIAAKFVLCNKFKISCTIVTQSYEHPYIHSTFKVKLL